MSPESPSPAPDKDARQADYLANRLLKNEKNLRRWARREDVGALRLYDKDIPEIPLAVELFRDPAGSAVAGEPAPGRPAPAGAAAGAAAGDALSISLYERPYEKDEADEARWLGLMATRAAEALGVAPELVFARTRRRMRGDAQYERLGTGKAERVVRECGLSFIVNLSDYLDTGLFLDHRPARSMVRAEAAGKRVLNLFCYTGSFSVYAAAGGAAEATSVDLSNTYLDWAERNLGLNGFTAARHPLVRAEARAFLAEAARRGERWDLIVADPPTFSNSKSSPEDFDVNRDWPALVRACLAVLAPGGKLYFSSNSRRLVWDPAMVPAPAEDLSEASIPPDFRDRRIHRAWRISAP
ncbi:MAG: class I SAM-dependent methyltransferase [Spirochaetaceae bacterium]|nr:class I SAM-dependent methyltransferase [Spirochaetaceae bacterium]